MKQRKPDILQDSSQARQEAAAKPISQQAEAFVDEFYQLPPELVKEAINSTFETQASEAGWVTVGPRRSTSSKMFKKFMSKDSYVFDPSDEEEGLPNIVSQPKDGTKESSAAADELFSDGVLLPLCLLYKGGSTPAAPVAVLSTKGTSRFNYVASILHVVIILFIIVTGLTKADTKSLSNFTPFGARSIFNASAILFFAYVGFDAVSTMAEETKNPARDIPIGLVGAMTITIVAYGLLALTLCLMVPYQKIDPDAPFSIAFSVVGMDWAKYIVAFGALKGMTTILLVSVVG
ncbi:hypothetical protein Taro_038975 [Colocasia esculenta]|uniref:Uncharacterized protein n=1 Tax=Colocasia esculenta TaxID=4460 RepID=A0A843WQ66_COLES|nr:hypothetical protein [Colocasia esculenta]